MSLVARQEGVAASQLFQWRKLERQRALMAVSAGEAVVPASEKWPRKTEQRHKCKLRACSARTSPERISRAGASPSSTRTGSDSGQLDTGSARTERGYPPCNPANCANANSPACCASPGSNHSSAALLVRRSCPGCRPAGPARNPAPPTHRDAQFYLGCVPGWPLFWRVVLPACHPRFRPEAGIRPVTSAA